MVSLSRNPFILKAIKKEEITKMKRFISIALVLLMVVAVGAAVACAKKADPVVGKWTVTKMVMPAMDMTFDAAQLAELGVESRFDIKADGTAVLATVGQDSTNYTWTVADGTYTFTAYNVMTAKIENGQLVIDDTASSGSVMYFDMDM